jgi:hypothetical protein
MRIYPLRQQTKWEDEMRSVCECGHCDYEHYEHGMYEGEQITVQCSTCTCPKYKFEQSLSAADAHELSDYIKDLAIKDKFIV